MQLRILTISGTSSNPKSNPYVFLTYLPHHSSASPRLSPRLPRPCPFPFIILTPTRNSNPNLPPHPHSLSHPRPPRTPHPNHPRPAKRPPRLAQRPPGAQSAKRHRSADPRGMDSACGLRGGFGNAQWTCAGPFGDAARGAEGNGDERVRRYVRVVVGWADAMAGWMSGSERYSV